jgi:peptidoglycan/LPS O-acetylase OafA/YrhL
MSGFLYGQKGNIENDLKFYKKNIVKILVDYYVVVVFVMLVFVVFLPEKRSTVSFMRALLLSGRLPGGEHLWYIPYCLLCYFITPFLSRYFSHYKDGNIIKALLLLCVLVFFIIEGFLNYFVSAWIICYIIGYFLGVVSNEGSVKLYKGISWCIVVAAALCNAVQIAITYVVKLKFVGIPAWFYDRFCNYAHVALGIALFVVLKFLFSKVFEKGYPKAIEKICTYSDKYSYDIYLVHQFAILGPLSMMSLTPVLGVNIALILTVTLVGAIVVNLISKFIKKKIK